MKKSKKPGPPSNPLVDSILWLCEATEGVPHAVGIRFDPTTNSISIKRIAGLRVIDNTTVEGLRAIRRLTCSEELELVGESGDSHHD